MLIGKQKDQEIEFENALSSANSKQSEMIKDAQLKCEELRSEVMILLREVIEAIKTLNSNYTSSFLETTEHYKQLSEDTIQRQISLNRSQSVLIESLCHRMTIMEQNYNRSMYERLVQMVREAVDVVLMHRWTSVHAIIAIIVVTVSIIFFLLIVST